ncbi:MAG: methyltransferase [Promethearchaeia archaeon]
MIIFILVLSVLILSLISVFLYKRNLIKNRKYYFLGLCGLIITYLLLPFYDPFQLPGYLASVVLGRTFPSYFGFTAGIIAGNCAIYAIHIFASSALEKRKRGHLLKIQFIRSGQYSKRRHPLYISSYFLALCYAVVMGSVVLVIIACSFLILFYFNAKYIEKNVLLKKFGGDYNNYQKEVRTLFFTKDFLVLTVVIHILFLIGLVGVIFFPML